MCDDTDSSRIVECCVRRYHPNSWRDHRHRTLPESQPDDADYRIPKFARILAVSLRVSPITNENESLAMELADLSLGRMLLGWRFV